MVDWFKVPPTFGHYYFAEKANDWDLAVVVRVQRIEDSSGIRCEVELDGEWIDVTSDRFNDSLWFGPLPKPTKPDPSLSKKNDN